jgi:hypothetical protein
MQSEQARQRRRERKRVERERQKAARKAQMCAGDELDFVLSRRVAALFRSADRAPRQRDSERPPGC